MSNGIRYYTQSQPVGIVPNNGYDNECHQQPQDFANGGRVTVPVGKEFLPYYGYPNEKSVEHSRIHLQRCLLLLRLR
jgi:hypothetical protein